jgi:hypothetical protein
MDLTLAGKALLLIVLAPVAALYDFATNPGAPPHIFVAQWNAGFPAHPIEPPPVVRPKHTNRVYVTRVSN